MSNNAYQPEGGEHYPAPGPANSYGTDDPERQAEIEAARSAASAERKRNRATLERLVSYGVSLDDAETLIDFHRPRTGAEAEGDITGSPPPSAEAASETEPAPLYAPEVFIVDLASAEQGIKHGLWIDANQAVEDIKADIAIMLETSPTPSLWRQVAWSVRGTKDMAGLNLDGVHDAATVAEIGQNVAKHGASYVAWVELVGTAEPELLATYLDRHVGSYENHEAWMKAVAKDLGWPSHLNRAVDPMLRPYLMIDYAAMAENTFTHGWDVVEGVDGQIHVFQR